MNRSTTFRLVNWKVTSAEYNEDNIASDINFSENTSTSDFQDKTSGPSTILLQWVNEQETFVQPRTTLYTLIGKRCVDVIASLFVIFFILSWLVPIIAILIYIDSPGPFYFNQYRTGHKGKPFLCLKFRTMVPHSTKAGFLQTAKDDARVTRLGRFLRRTNLDEMLQFINVFIGDMTLVGPRPHAVLHDAMHWTSPQYRERYLVKPGITGLAQIKGARGATDHPQRMEQRVRYDHFYINRQTFLLDMKICLNTVLLTLQGDSNAW